MGLSRGPSADGAGGSPCLKVLTQGLISTEDSNLAEDGFFLYCSLGGEVMALYLNLLED